MNADGNHNAAPPPNNHRPARTGVAASCLLALMATLMGLPGCKKSPTPDASPAQSAPTEPPPRPNILLIMIDTLRADALGAYGPADTGTPNIDAIAAEGVVFNRMISQAPWTQPSIASLFSSRYAGVHKVVNYTQAFKATYQGAQRVMVFDKSFETLAECLQSAGYATAALVANPFILTEYGFAQGFDHFDTSFAQNTTPGRVVNDSALIWLNERDQSKPFFMYLHYMDVHGPFDAAPDFLSPLLDQVEKIPNKRRLTDEEFQNLRYLNKLPRIYLADAQRHERLYPFREYWLARYQAGVRQIDHFIGDVRQRLADLGLWDDTYVIITSDHGEALCEHGQWEHGWSVHHTDLWIPLILRWPGHLPANRRVRQTLRLIDLMPTLLDQLRLDRPKGLQGYPLTSYIAGRPPSRPALAFAEAVKIGPEQKGIYVGDWKLMVTPATGSRQLFNIAKDPYEQNNLLDRYPQQSRQ
ncbi:MAG: sulfatase, partial [Phycisphaerae bacterium]